MKKSYRIFIACVLLCALFCGCAGEVSPPEGGTSFSEQMTDAVVTVPVTDTADTETEAATDTVTEALTEAVTESVTEAITETEQLTESVPPVHPEPTVTPPTVVPPREIKMTIDFVGDVVLAAENGYDGFWSFNEFAYETEPSYYFSAMREIFSSDDFTVANGENVFSDRELEPVEKTGVYTYWYRSGTANAAIYPAGSIEIVSLANNHILDYGPEGRDDTVSALKDAGVTVVPDGYSVTLRKGGLRVGLLCISMYSEYFLPTIREWLDAASETTDYQIVYYHGGTERTHVPDDWRVRASHAMVDAGADLVLGNHPHFLQPMETYNGAVILYSLGDFLFGGAHTEQNGNRTAVFRLELTYADGKITDETDTLIPCYCYGELWQPAPITDEGQKRKVLDFLAGNADAPY